MKLVTLIVKVLVICATSSVLFEAEGSSSGTFLDIRGSSLRQPQQIIESGSERAYTSNYQSLPLWQGYGAQHYVTAWIGTPPQRQTLLVDTGSPYTAFPCKGCADCDEHMDPYFDPKLSGLSNCSHCILGASCVKYLQNMTEQCQIRQSYSDEASSWTAYQAADSFSLGDDNSTARLPFAIPFVFHCQTTRTGLFATQLMDGILGLSAHPDTLVPIMVQQNKLLHNMFSLCFHNEPVLTKESGLMTLGGVDERLHESPMVYAKRVKKEDYGIGSASNAWYYSVHVKNIYLMEGSATQEEFDSSFMLPQSRSKNKHIHPITHNPVQDLRLINSGKGAVIDSGTTDTYLGTTLKTPFEAKWKEIMSSKGWADYHNEEIKLRENDILSLPSILIQLQTFDSKTTIIGDPNTVPGLTGSIDSTSPSDVIFVIPPTHYMEYSSSKDTYTSRVYFTESFGSVLGANSMQGHDILFDSENDRIGFAKSSCSYEVIEESNNEELFQKLENSGNEEGAVVADCILGAPSLSITCVDSVEEDINAYCTNNINKNHELRGYEQWLRVIETDASAAGKSCLEISKSFLDDSSGGSAECSDEGVCIETRPCSLSCSSSSVKDYLRFMDTQPEEKNNDKNDKSWLPCGDNLFGACQPKCTQSKTETVLMEDGKCHVTGEVTTRPCHIDDCGRDNPCVIPYLIHCIFEVAGVNLVKFWDKTHEEVFSGAIAGAICEILICDKIQVGPGDVKVLIASRLSDSGSAEVLGLKIVAEVSVFSSELSPEDALFIACHEEYLLEFLHQAELIHSALREESFMQSFFSQAESLVLGTPNNSSFDLVDRQRSKLLTSWIIKTAVDKADLSNSGPYEEDNIIRWDRLSNPKFLTVGFTILFFIIVLGIYCWYEMEDQRDGWQHDAYARSHDRPKIDATQRNLGTYTQIASNEDDTDHLMLKYDEDELSENECDGDIEFS